MKINEALKMYLDAALGGEPIALHYFRRELPPGLYRQFVQAIPAAIDADALGKAPLKVERNTSDQELEALIERFGSTTIIARLMEQVRLLAEDGEVRDEVAGVVRQLPCDTEFVFSICEYTNLITYSSDTPELNSLPWSDEEALEELMDNGQVVNRTRRSM